MTLTPDERSADAGHAEADPGSIQGGPLFPAQKNEVSMLKNFFCSLILA